MLNKKYRSIVDGWKWQEGEWSFEQQKAARVLNGLDDYYNMTIRDWGQFQLAVFEGLSSKNPHYMDVFNADFHIYHTEQVK